MEVDQKPLKYVVVTGGVISGLGKGVLASSTGLLLRKLGYKVTAIKIDPYLNVDAGLMSPFEHGEVFILDDGGEADLDLGNYERFMDITLGRRNNITNGKIYQAIINKERSGWYLGKTVQVIPHVTDLIQDWIEEVANKDTVPGEHRVAVTVDEEPFIKTRGTRPDVCIIELGGTIGDIESSQFVEALRQFQFRVGRENLVFVHVSLVPCVAGEQKTKPTQASVRQLRALGLNPDIIACRSDLPLRDQVKKKVAQFCHVGDSHVLTVYNVSNLFRVPMMLNNQGFVHMLLGKLDLPCPDGGAQPYLTQWEDLAEKLDALQQRTEEESLKLAFVGKYTGMSDSYLCVNKSLLHAGIALDTRISIDYIDSSLLEDEVAASDPEKHEDAWKRVKAAHCILVPGGFGLRGMEGKVLTCRYARENGVPFLGICLGFQAAVIDIARTIPGMENVISEEMDEMSDPKTWVISYMPEIDRLTMGANMRLGARKTIIQDPECKVAKLYGATEISERHRHRYEVNLKMKDRIEAETKMRFVGHDDSGERMEIFEVDDHPYFVGVQFHPEMKTRPLCPSPVFVGLVEAAKQFKAALEATKAS